jgi:hypothetical protein
MEPDNVIAAVRAWPDEIRAAARAAHKAAVEAGKSGEAAILDGYDAGLEQFLAGTTDGGRKLITHAIGLFGRSKIRVLADDEQPEWRYREAAAARGSMPCVLQHPQPGESNGTNHDAAPAARATPRRWHRRNNVRTRRIRSSER